MRPSTPMTLATLALLLLTPLGRAANGAEPDLAVWTHMAPVELADRPTKGLVEFALPPEVMALARPDLADLRVTTTAGAAVPYVLRVDREEAKRSVPYVARLFNPLYVPGTQSTVTVDFGARAARTRIEVDTPGTNFRRRVSVEASPDGTTWAVLKKSDWLFRIGYATGSYNKSDVALPDNDFQFLRITVFNAPDDPEQVAIRTVTAWQIKTTAPPTIAVPARVSVTENAPEKVTEITADLGFENLPLYEVALAFDDPNFVRRVEVLGRNVRSRTIIEPVENSQPRRREVDEPWSSLAGASVYRLPGGEAQEPSTGLSLRLDGQCRYLLVRIYNGDDAPLKFGGIKVQRLQEFVAFRAESAGGTAGGEAGEAGGGTGGGAGTYEVFFGNAGAARPQYDLGNFSDRLRAEGVTPATLGAAAPNPRFAMPVKVVPWSERNAGWLWVSLAVVLGVLTALVLRQARGVRRGCAGG